MSVISSGSSRAICSVGSSRISSSEARSMTRTSQAFASSSRERSRRASAAPQGCHEATFKRCTGRPRWLGRSYPGRTTGPVQRSSPVLISIEEGASGCSRPWARWLRAGRARRRGRKGPGRGPDERRRRAAVRLLGHGRLRARGGPGAGARGERRGARGPSARGRALRPGRPCASRPAPRCRPAQPP